MEVAELGTVAEYLESGPGYVFLFHPALGPLWDVIAQKVGTQSLRLPPCPCGHAPTALVRGHVCCEVWLSVEVHPAGSQIRRGSLGSRSELVLEVAEADIEGLAVQDGASLLVGRLPSPACFVRCRRGWDAI